MILVLLAWLILGIAPVAVPSVLMAMRRTRKLGIAFLVVYAVAYLIFAFNGHYVARDVGSGGWGVVGP